jgi:hypothetical protein
VLLVASDTTGSIDLWLAPADFGPPRLWRRTPQTELVGLFSPDGRWMLSASAAAAGPGVEVVAEPYPSPGPRTVVPAGPTIFGEWAPDGRRYYTVDPNGAVWETPADRNAPGGPQFGTPRMLYQADASVVVRGFSGHAQGMLVARRNDAERDVALVGVLGWQARAREGGGR